MQAWQSQSQSQKSSVRGKSATPNLFSQSTSRFRWHAWVIERWKRFVAFHVKLSQRSARALCETINAKCFGGAFTEPQIANHQITKLCQSTSIFALNGASSFFDLRKNIFNQRTRQGNKTWLAFKVPRSMPPFPNLVFCYNPSIQTYWLLLRQCEVQKLIIPLIVAALHPSEVHHSSI